MADTTLCLPSGAGPALLPQAHRLRPAHLPLGQSHPHGAAGIGGPAPSPCHKPAGGHRGAPQPLLPHRCLAGAGIAALRPSRNCGSTAAGGEPLLPHTSTPGPPVPQGGRGTHTSFNPPGAEAITDLTACALEWGLWCPQLMFRGAVSPCLGASPKEVTLSPHGNPHCCMTGSPRPAQGGGTRVLQGALRGAKGVLWPRVLGLGLPPCPTAP